MPEEDNAKDYSWLFTSASVLISKGPCELHFAILSHGGGGAEKAILYDGESASGDIIEVFRTQGSGNHPFKPPKPVYCRKGLYIQAITEIEGFFCQWQELGSKG